MVRKVLAGAKAEHCRELARWTSDGRTRHILIDMADELETAAAEDPPSPTGEARPPRSLS